MSNDQAQTPTGRLDKNDRNKSKTKNENKKNENNNNDKGYNKDKTIWGGIKERIYRSTHQVGILKVKSQASG